jgi:hypothetical protein
LSVAIKRRDNDQTEDEVTWSGVELGSGWRISDHYLEIAYDTSDPSWGAQVYTDNMDDSASPKYTGDPDMSLHQQPAGLIGELNTLVACPMSWMALDDKSGDVPVPVEEANEYPPNHPDYKVYFKSDTGGMWGGAEAQSEWLWLKDVNSTKWDEDTNGNGRPDPEEIIPDFSLTGDEYSTFISPTGIATGWGDIDEGARVYIMNPESPVFIYLASKFTMAKELQSYKTNTLTLELYNY